MQKYFGVAAAAAAFVMWGSLPLYWKQVAEVPPLEVLCHRTAWSLVFTAFIIMVMGRGSVILRELSQPSNVRALFLSALLLGANWLLYIWSVNSGYIVEASLGYFINPLLNIFCGFLFFGERLRRGQIAALALALLAVLYLTFCYGKFPWIALTLAVSFASYAVVHKKSTVPALDALFIETIMLVVPAVAYIVYLQINGTGFFLGHGISLTLLLAGAGVATTVPLLCFGYAAHNLRLATLGIFQYIAPTISLLIGIFYYHEAFPPQRLIGFSLVWLAILLYVGEGLFQRLKQKNTVLTGKI